MKPITRKIINLLIYLQWIDCEHKNLEQIGLMGWRCKNCKAPVRD